MAAGGLPVWRCTGQNAEVFESIRRRQQTNSGVLLKPLDLLIDGREHTGVGLLGFSHNSAIIVVLFWMVDHQILGARLDFRRFVIELALRKVR